MLFYKAFVIKPFHILSPILRSISHKNTIDTSLTSKKCHLAKFCKVDAGFKRLFLREKQVFLVGFTLTFPRFPR